MDQLTELLPLALTMLFTGVVAGILAGLLGVGGGIVIVPVLDTALGMMGTDPAIRMHVAVATSLATIVPTSISSSRAHHRKGAVDLGIARYWGPWILLGSVLGTLLAARLSRSDEYEADEYAAALLTKAGIGTTPQKSLFRKLDELTRARSGAMPAWLMSHPKTAERITAIEALEGKWAK